MNKRHLKNNSNQDSKKTQNINIKLTKRTKHKTEQDKGEHRSRDRKKKVSRPHATSPGPMFNKNSGKMNNKKRKVKIHKINKNKSK